MAEQRIDYDALKRRIIDGNARLIDNTFEAYTKGQNSRKEEFVTLWKASFDRVTDPEALRDGSDGMLLNGILMEAILKGEVKSDFADWVFPGERARKLARALEEVVRIGGVVPRYNRRDMPSAIEAYRAKRPKVGGSFSARLSASLAEDAGDIVEDWVLGRGDWAPYVAKGDRTREIFTGLHGGGEQTTLQKQMADLQQQIDAAYAARQGARAAELEQQLEQLCEQIVPLGPTLEQQMADLQQQIDEAYTNRLGAIAAGLETELAMLQQQAVPQVSTLAADQITDLQRRIDEAYASRQGAVAAQLETELATLQAQAGPTLAEIREFQVSVLQKQIDEAYANRQGGRAVELEAELFGLQKGAEIRTIPLAQSMRQPTTSPIAVTPTITIVNGPAAGDHAALETKRSEVEALVASARFRVAERRQEVLQSVFTAKNVDELENIRQHVVANS